jgi:hypothetical protein
MVAHATRRGRALQGEMILGLALGAVLVGACDSSPGDGSGCTPGELDVPIVARRGTNIWLLHEDPHDH